MMAKMRSAPPDVTRRAAQALGHAAWKGPVIIDDIVEAWMWTQKATEVSGVTFNPDNHAVTASCAGHV